MARIDVAEEICQSIDIILQERLRSLPYDKTIIATVTDNSKATKGIYTLSSDTNSKFIAYSERSDWKIDDKVYVRIPQGDYGAQKVIVGAYIYTETSSYINFLNDRENGFYTRLQGVNLIPKHKSLNYNNNDFLTSIYQVYEADNEELGKELVGYTGLHIPLKYRITANYTTAVSADLYIEYKGRDYGKLRSYNNEDNEWHKITETPYTIKANSQGSYNINLYYNISDLDITDLRIYIDNIIGYNPGELTFSLETGSYGYKVANLNTTVLHIFALDYLGYDPSIEGELFTTLGARILKLDAANGGVAAHLAFSDTYDQLAFGRNTTENRRMENDVFANRVRWVEARDEAVITEFGNLYNQDLECYAIDKIKLWENIDTNFAAEWQSTSTGNIATYVSQDIYYRNLSLVAIGADDKPVIQLQLMDNSQGIYHLYGSTGSLVTASAAYTNRNLVISYFNPNKVSQTLNDIIESGSIISIYTTSMADTTGEQNPEYIFMTGNSGPMANETGLHTTMLTRFEITNWDLTARNFAVITYQISSDYVQGDSVTNIYCDVKINKNTEYNGEVQLNFGYSNSFSMTTKLSVDLYNNDEDKKLVHEIIIDGQEHRYIVEPHIFNEFNSETSLNGYTVSYEIIPNLQGISLIGNEIIVSSDANIENMGSAFLYVTAAPKNNENNDNIISTFGVYPLMFVINDSISLISGPTMIIYNNNNQETKTEYQEKPYSITINEDTLEGAILKWRLYEVPAIEDEEGNVTPGVITILKPGDKEVPTLEQIDNNFFLKPTAVYTTNNKTQMGVNSLQNYFVEAYCELDNDSQKILARQSLYFVQQNVVEAASVALANKIRMNNDKYVNNTVAGYIYTADGRNSGLFLGQLQDKRGNIDPLGLYVYKNGEERMHLSADGSMTIGYPNFDGLMGNLMGRSDYSNKISVEVNKENYYALIQKKESEGQNNYYCNTNISNKNLELEKSDDEKYARIIGSSDQDWKEIETSIDSQGILREYYPYENGAYYKNRQNNTILPRGIKEQNTDSTDLDVTITQYATEYEGINVNELDIEDRLMKFKWGRPEVSTVTTGNNTTPVYINKGLVTSLDDLQNLYKSINNNILNVTEVRVNENGVWDTTTQTWETKVRPYRITSKIELLTGYNSNNPYIISAEDEGKFLRVNDQAVIAFVGDLNPGFEVEIMRNSNNENGNVVFQVANANTIKLLSVEGRTDALQITEDFGVSACKYLGETNGVHEWIITGDIESVD